MRITKVSTARIIVKKDDWGAIDIPPLNYTLAFPATEDLRAFT